MKNTDKEESQNEAESASEPSGDESKGGDDEILFERLGGEVAISAVVEEFYSLNTKDERVGKFFSNINLNGLIQHQKEFIAFAFGKEGEYNGKPLTEAHAGLGITEEDFAAVGENLVTALMNCGVDQQLIDEAMKVVVSVKGEVMGEGKAGRGEGTTVNYDLQQEHCDILIKHLAWVVEAVGSLEEAGQTIYDAIFNAAGDGKKLFVSPKRVTAFRFISQVQRYVNGSADVDYLDAELYNMSMRHIAYISPLQSKQYMPVFIGQIIGVIKGVLDEEWDAFGAESWDKLLSYLGGMLIRNLAEFTGKVHIIRRSWATITKTDTGSKTSGHAAKDSAEGEEVAEEGDAATKKGAGKGNVSNFGESLFFNVGVMSPEIAAKFVRTKEELAPLFGAGFASLTELISDPNLLNEELYILGIRHLKYGTREEYFPVFGQAVMVTLRSMLPRDWNWAHEDAWGWLWETCSKYLCNTIEQGHVNKYQIDETMDRLVGQDMVALGIIVYVRLFELSDEVQNFFYKPNAMVTYIVEKVMFVLSSISHQPEVISHEIRALGMRHIKYNIPPVHFPLLGKAMLYALSTVLEGFWTDQTEKSWLSVFEFVMRTMTRAVNEGSNLVTKSMVNNSVEEMEDALKQAPRGVRAMWVLEVNVSGEILSPFYWALYDGKQAMSKYILRELLIMRADRETYYFGAKELFLTHPGLVKNLAVLSPQLLPDLFDGLMWRSRLTDKGLRRVNYYIKDIYGDPTCDRYVDPYHTPLAELGRLHYAELYEHPVPQYIVGVKWDRFARSMFIQQQALFLLMLILFMIAYAGFYYDEDQDSANYQGTYASRIVLFVVNLFVFLCRQIPRLVTEIKRNQMYDIGFGGVQVLIPISLSKPTNVARLCVHLLLIVCFLGDSEITNLFPTNVTTDMANFTEALSSVLLWILLYDWFALDIYLAKFKLQWGTLCAELFTPLTLAVCLLTGFGTAMTLGLGDYANVTTSTHGQVQHFSDAGASWIYLFAIFTGNYVVDSEMLSPESTVFYVLFVLLSNVLLLTLMGSIFTSVTFLQNQEITGLTFLERGKDIVELESMCSIEKREAVFNSLGFENRIEFDEGDLGIDGGIQVYESLSRDIKNATADDRIQRYPGEASSKIPWPVIQSSAKTVDEKLIHLEAAYGRIAKMVRDMLKLADVKGKGGAKAGVSSDQSQSKEEGSATERAGQSKDSEED